jgi:hypothetical protein
MKELKTSVNPIRIYTNIKIDNRFYVSIEYYQFVIIRPEFFRKLFPSQKFLSWEKKNQPPPEPKTFQTKNKFIYCPKKR